jgi:hypothetical protein
MRLKKSKFCGGLEERGLRLMLMDVYEFCNWRLFYGEYSQ